MPTPESAASLPQFDLTSIPGIADQRFSRPEQQHQEDPGDAQHHKYRLVEDDLEDAVPEPGHVALDPGAERLLAGLMDIVPELAKPRESQALIGDPTRAVIDHQDESARQQQQPHQSEKAADHVSPHLCAAKCGGSEVPLLCAASPPRELPNQNHT